MELTVAGNGICNDGKKKGAVLEGEGRGCQLKREVPSKFVGRVNYIAPRELSGHSAQKEALKSFGKTCEDSKSAPSRQLSKRGKDQILKGNRSLSN